MTLSLRPRTWSALSTAAFLLPPNLGSSASRATSTSAPSSSTSWAPTAAARPGPPVAAAYRTPLHKSKRRMHRPGSNERSPRCAARWMRHEQPHRGPRKSSTRTVTLFSAVGAAKGGIQRAIMCSYEAKTPTLYRKSVLRTETSGLGVCLAFAVDSSSLCRARSD